MKHLILITTLLWSLSAYPERHDLTKMFEGIKYIETKNNPMEIGDNGKAFGIAQIHKIAVDDVNRMYGTNYTHYDAFDERCAEEIFHLYITAGIERFTRIYKRPPTEGEVVRMWNGGIYQGYRIKATIKYYRRYEQSAKQWKLSA